MPFPRTPTKDELAGLECATADHNDAKEVETVVDGVPETTSEPLTPEEYWDYVYSKVRGRDPRPEVEVFDAAVLSYQSHFDVGLGSAGVAALQLTIAQALAAQEAVNAANLLKTSYETEVRAKGAMK